MLKDILIVLIIALIAAIIFLIIFNAFRKKSMMMMKAVYADRNFEEYRRLANSLSGKLFLSKKQRLIFNMTIYENENNDELLLETFKKLEKQKLNDQQKLDLYYNELRYYIRHKDSEKVDQLYEEVQTKYKSNESSLIKGIMKEIYYLYEVDYKENIELIDEVKNLYNNITVEYSKGIFAARCCKLYLKNKDLKNAKFYYEKAKTYLNEAQMKEMLNDISFQ